MDRVIKKSIHQFNKKFLRLFQNVYQTMGKNIRVEVRLKNLVAIVASATPIC